MDESLIREQEAQLQKTGRYYKHICFMAVPVLCMACFLYGVRPLLLCGIAVLAGNCATVSFRCCAAACIRAVTFPTRALRSSLPC